MSIIQPLYFTALKCREPDIRHRSVVLLGRCGKEGVWDGDVMGKVAQHVVVLEESKRCLNTLTEKLELTEQDRICGTAINFMRSERKVWVQCSTRKWDSRRVEMSKKMPHGDQGYVWEFCEKIIYL